MVTRPNSPASKGREELVKQVSMLPAFLLKNLQGGKTWDEVTDIARGIKKEGGTNADIYDETKKYTDPETSTGVYQEPGGSFVFNIPDNEMKLKPLATDEFKNRFTGEVGGSTGDAPLGDLMKHDLLYGFVPELQKVTGNLSVPEARDYGAEIGGSYFQPGYNYLRGKDFPEGYIEAQGRSYLDPNSDEMFSVRNILAHEINHSLQNRFKLPQGSNPDNPEMLNFFQQEMQPFAGKMSGAVDKEFQEWLSTQNPDFAANPEKARKLWERMKPQMGRLATDAETIKRLDPNRKADRMTMYEKGVAGEIAANRASKDLGKNAEQLRSEYPFAVDPDEFTAPFQMLRYGNSPTDWEKPDLKHLGGIAYRKGS